MRTEQDGASGGKEEAEAGQEPGKLWKPRDAGFKLPTDRRGSKPCRIRNSKFRTYCHMKIGIRKASKSSPYKAVREEHPTDKGREPEGCAYKTGKRSRLRFLIEEQLTHGAVLVPGVRPTDSLVLYVAPCSPVWPPPSRYPVLTVSAAVPCAGPVVSVTDVGTGGWCPVTLVPLAAATSCPVCKSLGLGGYCLLMNKKT